MAELNKNYKLRDKIIFGEEVDWKKGLGGVKRYEGLTLNQLELLSIGNFLDPEATQNFSPTVREFIQFVEKFPKFVCHGYAVSPDRNDYRVSIEGVSFRGEYNTEILKAFAKIFHSADEFVIEDEYLYCWYD